MAESGDSPVNGIEIAGANRRAPRRMLFSLLVSTLCVIVLALLADRPTSIPVAVQAVFLLLITTLITLAHWGWTVAHPSRAWIPSLMMLLGICLFLVPSLWNRTAAIIAVPSRPEVQWTLLVPVGNAKVPRGEPVTLTACLDRPSTASVFPDRAVLRIQQRSDTQPLLLPVKNDGRGLFTWTLPAVDEEFQYQVEVPELRLKSAWYHISPVQTISLSSASCFRSEPPEHRSGLPPIHSQLGSEVVAYPAGKLTVDLQWNHPVKECYLEWIAEGESEFSSPGHRYQLQFHADCRSGTLTLPITSPGTMRWLGIDSTGYMHQSSWRVSLVPDRPPEWQQISGLAPSRFALAPGEAVELSFQVRDDLGWPDVVLEAATPDLTQHETISGKWQKQDGFTIVGRCRWRPPPTWGERFLLRLRAADQPLNRQQQPHVSYFPAAGWSEFTTQAGAAPLAEQWIRYQHERSIQRLKTLQTLAENGVTVARALPSANSPERDFGFNSSVHFEALRRLSAEMREECESFAKEFRIAPDWRPLLRAVSEMSQRDLLALERMAIDAGRRTAPRPGDPGATDWLPRWLQLQQQLSRWQILERQRLPWRLAFERLEHITDALELHSTSGPWTPERAAALREWLRQFTELLEAPGPLSQAILVYLRNDYLRLADTLASCNRELEQLRIAWEVTRQRDRRQKIAHSQSQLQSLTETTAHLIKELAIPLRLAETGPLDSRSLEEARSGLQDGDLTAAMTALEKAARELERVATRLRIAAEARSDAKEAARQLAAWQTALRTHSYDAGPLSNAMRSEFIASQSALIKAVARLADRLPSTDAKLVELCDQARIQMEKVIAAWQQQDDPEAALRAAEALLHQLAERCPTREARLRATRPHLQRLRQQQQLLSGAVERAVANAERSGGFHELADKQAKLAATLARLDCPGLDLRLKMVLAILQRAEADLRQELVDDIPISQQQARQHLEWLSQAIDGITPDDELATAIADRQQTLADAAGQAAGEFSTDQRKQWLQEQRELSRKLQAIGVATALPVWQAAREATSIAERALAGGSTEAITAAIREAAMQTRLLAQRINGQESELARMQRLLGQMESLRKRFPSNAESARTTQEILGFAQALRGIQAEFEQTRSGASVQQRQEVQAIFHRWQQASPKLDEGEMIASLVQAQRTLIEAMTRRGDRSEPLAVTQPPPLQELGFDAPSGWLPDREQAGRAARLAQQLRTLRDQLSRFNAELSRGVLPAPGDPLKVIAEQQLRISAKITQPPSPSRLDTERWQRRNELLLRLQQELNCGHPDAVSTARAVAAMLQDESEAHEWQQVIVQPLESERSGYGGYASRQLRRVQELAAELHHLERMIEGPTPLPTHQAMLSADSQAKLESLLQQARTQLLAAISVEKQRQPEQLTTALHASQSQIREAEQLLLKASTPQHPTDAGKIPSLPGFCDIAAAYQAIRTLSGEATPEADPGAIVTEAVSRLRQGIVHGKKSLLLSEPDETFQYYRTEE